MCAYLDRSDRESLVDLGFRQSQGDHFEYCFADGQRWLLEFPDRQVDGNVIAIMLGNDDALDVISLESLIIDRLVQATDGTTVTFDEAVRLCIATFERADWTWIEQEVGRRETDQQAPGLSATFARVRSRTTALLEG